MSRRKAKPHIKSQHGVQAKSVGHVRRALAGVTGIRKIRLAGHDGKLCSVVIVHTNTTAHFFTSGLFAVLQRLRREAELLGGDPVLSGGYPYSKEICDLLAKKGR